MKVVLGELPAGVFAIGGIDMCIITSEERSYGNDCSNGNILSNSSVFQSYLTMVGSSPI